MRNRRRGGANAKMAAGAESIVIRPYQHKDSAAVTDLFIRVNRALAPNGMEEAFESYIALALAQEISRIPDYYGGPDRGFWVAVDAAGRLLGTYGLEPAPPDGWN